MRKILVLSLVLALAALGFGEAAYTAYITKLYKTNGGDKMVVTSGGEIEVQSGGILDFQAGSLMNVSYTDNTDMPAATTAGQMGMCSNCDSGIAPALMCSNGTAWVLCSNGTLPDNLVQ